jgi:hypothetical protein
MSAASWAAYLTSLPGRIIGSLGPTKRDLAPVGSHTYYEPAQEKELIRNWVGWLAECVGLPSGYAAGSVQGRLDALEGTAAEYRFDDFFDQENGVPDPLHWDVSGAGVVLSTDPGGGVKIPLDASDFLERGAYLWTREQRQRVWCSVTLGGAPSAFCPLIWFVDSGGTNAWGIEFKPAANEVVIFNETGGSGVETHLGTFVVDTEFALFFEVREDGHVWATMNNGTEVDGGAAPAGSMKFRMQSHTGGAAGEFMIVRLLRHRATW